MKTEPQPAPVMATRSVKVWDLPVRVTHWSFAVLIPAMYITAENHAMGWHMRLGHLLLALLVFRFVWGFVGTRTARFSNFVKGPGAIAEYLRLHPDHRRSIGHSPLAALSVLALLGAMLAQVVMGLFSGDPFDGATGPLNDLVGVSTADTITETHEAFFYAIVALVVLHLGAIAYYTMARKQKLVGAMVGGKAEKADDVEGNTSGSLVAFAFSVAVAIGVTWWVWSGVPPFG